MGRAKGAPPKAKKVPLYKKNNVPLLRAPNKSEGRMKRAMDPRLLCLKKRPAKPWRDCSDLEKARAQRVVGGWAEEHKQELAHKAPTGAEYAELVGMMFKFEIAASTARALFARKKRIVARWRQSFYEFRRAQWRACAEEGGLSQRAPPDYGAR